MAQTINMLKLAQLGGLPAPPPSGKARRSLPPPRGARASFGAF